MTWEDKFRQLLLGAAPRSLPFYEGAGCDWIVRQQARAEFANAVRRYQARYRLEPKPT